MPLRGDRSPAEEKAEPASTIFSPVARDYPSRAFGGFFRSAALAAVLSRNGYEYPRFTSKNKGFLPHNLFTSNAKWISWERPVNNFGLHCTRGIWPNQCVEVSAFRLRLLLRKSRRTRLTRSLPKPKPTPSLQTGKQGGRTPCPPVWYRRIRRYGEAHQDAVWHRCL